MAWRILFCRQLGYGVGSEKDLPSTFEVVLVQALGGVCAGATSSIATTPMDTIKTRLQVLIMFIHWLPYSHVSQYRLEFRNYLLLSYVVIFLIWYGRVAVAFNNMSQLRFSQFYLHLTIADIFLVLVLLSSF